MRWYLFILFLLLSATSFAQTDSVLNITLEKSIGDDIRLFTTDALGNIYIVNQRNQLKKLNENGDSIAVFNDIKRYGQIYYVDAGNPLKILVYFKDFATIVILDRLLNVRNTIDLRKQNIFQVQAITASYDGNIWLYDEQESKLKKINDFGKILLESADFRLVFDSVPQPAAMFDVDGQLYLYDRLKGLIVLDYYGARKNHYPLFNLTNLQVIDKNTIVGRNNERITLFKPLVLKLDNLYIPGNLNNTKQIRFTRNRFYELKTNGILGIFNNP